MKKKVEKVNLVFAVLIFTFVPCLHAAIVHVYESMDINEGDSFDTLQIHQSMDIPPIQTIINMYGGSISTVNTLDDSVINIYGGSVSSNLAISHTSTVNVYGGEFYQVLIDETATLNIYGYEFETETIADVHTLLTGYLADDNAFSMLFYRKSVLPEQVNLVPEPATLLMLCVGGLVLRKRK